MKNVYRLSEKNKNELIKKCVASLKEKGTFLLVPTETVYGLICSYDDELGKNKIYRAKGRSKGKPFQLLVSSLEMLEMVGVEINYYAKMVADKFCPGPITIIVSAKHSKEEKIGFRIPQHNFIFSLLQEFNAPLAATSANISGDPPALKVKTAINTLNLSPDMIIDGGEIIAGSKASTVVDLTGSEVRILREGPIKEEEIREAVRK